MSDTATPDTQDTAQTNGQAGEGQPAPAPITILAQYVKDLSFENPRAPASLAAAAQKAPQVEINVDVQARDMQNDVYEVSLRIVGTARSAPTEEKAEAETAFILDLSYGGLFRLQGVKDELRKPVLLIEAPRLLFPFAREIMANVSRQGGFPPLLINPVDFADLYRRQAMAAGGDTVQGTAPAAGDADDKFNV
ncbi:MAG: protein-export chaperone SecB [Alphaproteobacteria bacterium]|nr:protein-export chaperone SecB [Alphaproteobacteria bacterium SS10]